MDTSKGKIAKLNWYIENGEGGVGFQIDMETKFGVRPVANVSDEGDALLIVQAVNAHEQLVAALRQIANISKPQFCMDGSAKVGSPNSSGYDTQLIARAALAAAGAA